MHAKVAMLPVPPYVMRTVPAPPAQLLPARSSSAPTVPAGLGSAHDLHRAGVLRDARVDDVAGLEGTCQTHRGERERDRRDRDVQATHHGASSTAVWNGAVSCVMKKARNLATLSPPLTACRAVFGGTAAPWPALRIARTPPAVRKSTVPSRTKIDSTPPCLCARVRPPCSRVTSETVERYAPAGR